MKDSCPGWSHCFSPSPRPSDWGVVLSFPKGVGEAVYVEEILSFLYSSLSQSSPNPPAPTTHLSGRWLNGFWAVSGESLGCVVTSGPFSLLASRT